MHDILKHAPTDGISDEHTVYLDDFWIYKYEVTVKQYRDFCTKTGYVYDWNKKKPSWGWKDNHPMVNVSWYDAQAYAKWAGVSLPTEAQWEKAAHGPNNVRYPWGNEWDPQKCNRGLDKGETAPIGKYQGDISPYYVHDMAGNASERCEDWLADYIQGSITRNPTGPITGVSKVLRGGGYGNDSNLYRTYSRFGGEPSRWHFRIGFRCVLRLSE